jgi:hypothetical protein
MGLSNPIVLVNWGGQTMPVPSWQANSAFLAEARPAAAIAKPDRQRRAANMQDAVPLPPPECATANRAHAGQDDESFTCCSRYYQLLS